MARPEIERLCHLGEISEAIVDARYSTKGAGLVVQDALDHVRRNSKGRHPCRRGPSEVMQGPVLHPAQLVELALPFAVAGDRVVPSPRRKDEIVVEARK